MQHKLIRERERCGGVAAETNTGVVVQSPVRYSHVTVLNNFEVLPVLETLASSPPLIDVSTQAHGTTRGMSCVSGKWHVTPETGRGRL